MNMKPAFFLFLLSCHFLAANAAEEQSKAVREEPMFSILNQSASQKRLSAMFMVYYLTVCKSNGVNRQELLKYVDEIYAKEGK